VQIVNSSFDFMQVAFHIS